LNRRKVNICCTQETKRKGEKTKEIGEGYKIIYSGLLLVVSRYFLEGCHTESARGTLCIVIPVYQIRAENQLYQHRCENASMLIYSGRTSTRNGVGVILKVIYKLQQIIL
jgi:hypothetical protein